MKEETVIWITKKYPFKKLKRVKNTKYWNEYVFTWHWKLCLRLIKLFYKPLTKL